MPIKDPEKRKAYQREWAAKKAAKAPPTWHKKKRVYKALWKAKKGKAYFRRKYREWIKRLAAEGRLDEVRASRAESTKGWRNKVFLEVLEEVRNKGKAPEPLPPPPEKGYTGNLHAIN